MTSGFSRYQVVKSDFREFLMNFINRQYYPVFSVLALVFCWGGQYFAEAGGRGKIRPPRQNNRANTENTRVMLYLLYT